MKKRIFIWLDDEREIPNKWLMRKTDEIEFKKFLNAEDLMEWYGNHSYHYDRIFISFDHDLGRFLTGYDVAKFIVENNYNLTGFAVHSMNPVGCKNIIELLTHYGYYQLKWGSEITTL